MVFDKVSPTLTGISKNGKPVGYIQHAKGGAILGGSAIGIFKQVGLGWDATTEKLVDAFSLSPQAPEKTTLTMAKAWVMRNQDRF